MQHKTLFAQLFASNRGGKIFLGILAALAIIVPVFNLAVPESSALHLSTYTITLLGKYLSYLIFGAVLAVILMALVIFGLGAPMLGQWWAVSLVIMALLFASLGIGFVISLISKTDTQAVQYSMIVLLTSVFFSGFILGLDTLWQPVRIISWTLPATYGILMLRDIMLTGDPLAWGILLQLTVIGGGLCALAWVLLRRSMAHS